MSNADMQVIKSGKRFAIVAVALVVIGLGIFQPWNDAEYFANEAYPLDTEIERFTNQVMGNNSIPGAAVAIVRNGKVLYSGVFGIADASNPNKKIGALSNFHLASISKAFVSMALIKKAEAGLIKLDEPVVKYYPPFTMKDPMAGAITIRQVMAHRSGIPDVKDYEFDNPSLDSLAICRYVETLSAQSLEFSPGTAWKYSNAGYDLLGAVLARVSGESFETVMKQTVILPLGLTSTTFYYPETDSALRTTGHIGKFKPIPVEHYPYNWAHAPSSTLQSNLNEIITFSIKVLPDESGRNALVSEQSVNEMWTVHGTLNEGLDAALGWFISDHEGSRLIIAAGRDPGFASMIALIPNQQVAVVTLTNSAIEPSIQLDFVRGLLDIGLGKPRQSIASISLPVGRVYEEKGVEAAIAEYYRIMEQKKEHYATGMAELTWLINELYKRGRYEDALKLLDVEYRAFPRCHVCFTYAKVYMKLGNRSQCEAYYKRWLEYLPEERDQEIESYLQGR